MKKLINRPEAVVEEMVEGLIALYPGLRRVTGRTVLVREDAQEIRSKQVTLISGGGSGHEPAHAGYVGRGMLSAAVAGEVFTSPSPEAVLSAIEAVGEPEGPGVLVIVKNYTGDRLNFGDAAERAKAKGIAVETVIVADDAALAGTSSKAGARGLAGTIFVHKIAGAAAEAGLSLEEVAKEAREAAEAVATMGVALSACTVPAAGKPSFELAEDEMELGLGIHGEPGLKRVKLAQADEVVGSMLNDVILPQLALEPGARVALMVNNLGATPTMELAIVARRAIELLEQKELIVERAYAGTFLSALEMAGISLSVLALDDQRLARLDAPTDAPAWPNSAARSSRTGTRTSTVADARNDARLTEFLKYWRLSAQTSAGRTLERVLHRVVVTLIDQADALNELDRAVGDGDLGSSLARGARAWGVRMSVHPALPYDRPTECLKQLTQILGEALGGSSGPLLAALLSAFSEPLGASRATLFDYPFGPMLGLAQALREGAAKVSKLGGANAGDRTLLDAILPTIAVFEEHGRKGLSWSFAIDQAALAARTGAESTAQMLPKFGRASYLGDRALGHPDPGAIAIAKVFEALASEFGRNAPQSI